MSFSSAKKFQRSTMKAHMCTKKKFFQILLASAFLSGCATSPSIESPIRANFNEADFSWSAKGGGASITGQAFLKTKGGDVKFGAGNTIKILPKTEYTTELRIRGSINGEKIGPVDPGLEKYTRTTIADGNGNFEFHNLPAGTWYLSTAITWGIPTQYGLQQTGGVAYTTATITDGEVKKVILTRN